MNLFDFKMRIASLQTLSFRLPNGQLIPPHFHITEMGICNKKFIDCGGTLRNEQAIVFQLWSSSDYDHRLEPNKLAQIIDICEGRLGENDHHTVEVEFQGQTIERYGLSFNGVDFLLTPLFTDCLDKDKCGIPALASANTTASTSSASCNPNSGCC